MKSVRPGSSTKIIFSLFIVIMIIPFAAISFYGIHAQVQEKSELVKLNLRSNCEAQVDAIETFIRENTAFSEYIISLDILQTYAVDGESPDSASVLLNAFHLWKEKNDHIGEIALADANWNLMLSTGEGLRRVPYDGRQYEKALATAPYTIGDVRETSFIDEQYSYIPLILHVDAETKDKGYLIATIKLDYFDELIERAVLPAEGEILILDSKGEILYATGAAASRHTAWRQINFDLSPRGLIEFSEQLGGRAHNYITFFSSVPGAGWHYYVTVRTDLLLNENALVRDRLLWLVAIALVAWIAIGGYASRQITRPTRTIISGIRAIESSGDYGLRLTETGDQDLRTIARSFNALLTKIARQLQALKLESERHAILTEISGEHIFDYDYENDMLTLSLTFAEMLDVSPVLSHFREWRGKSMESTIQLSGLLLGLLDSNEMSGTADIEQRDDEGNEIWLRCTYAFVRDGENRPQRVIGKCVNVEKERRAMDKLKRQASIDGLTGIDNRVSGEAQVRDYLENIEVNEVGALLIMDLDDLKKVNDNQGHPAGDGVLRSLADTLRQYFRKTDMVCRWGGDEFVALVKDVTDQNILNQRVRKLNEVLAGKAEPLSVSIGMAYFKKPHTEYDAVYGNADEALYRAKKGGKARVVIYDSTNLTISEE